MGHLIGGSCQTSLVDSLIRANVLTSKPLQDAFYAIDRNLFHKHNSYENRPFKIDTIATISTPQQHAQVMEVLLPYMKAKGNVLDIGCGSGYLVAIMAKVMESTPGGHVYGVDIVPNLVKYTTENVRQLQQRHILTNIDNITIVLNNNATKLINLTDNLKFDAIHCGVAIDTMETINTLASTYLNTSGCLLIPFGVGNAEQVLLKVHKTSANELQYEKIMSVLCQPMLRTPPSEDTNAILETRQAKKERLENELKTWRHTFEIQHGTKPTRQDLSADCKIKTLFEQYRAL